MTVAAHDPHVRNHGTASAGYRTVIAYPARTWVSYRASLARIIDMPDTASCGHCGCELDGDPIPHSPRCLVDT